MNKPTFLMLALLSILTASNITRASEARAALPTDLTTCNVQRACPKCGKSDVVPFTQLTPAQQTAIFNLRQEKLKEAAVNQTNHVNQTNQWVLGILTVSAFVGALYQRMRDTQTNDAHASETLQDWFSKLLEYKP